MSSTNVPYYLRATPSRLPDVPGWNPQPQIGSGGVPTAILRGPSVDGWNPQPQVGSDGIPQMLRWDAPAPAGWNPQPQVGADGVPAMLERPAEAAPTDWAEIGGAMQIASAFTAIIGAVGQAMIGRIGLKAQADALQHQGYMASVNARRAEQDAQAVMQAAQTQFARLSAEAGQFKAKQQTGAAARGVVVGQGSSGDALASTDTVKSIDRMTINKNAVRQAGAIRMGAANQRGASLMANIGAGNLNRSARGISPASAGMSAAMRGIGEYAWNRAGDYGYRRGNNAYRQTGVS